MHRYESKPSAERRSANQNRYEGPERRAGPERRSGRRGRSGYGVESIRPLVQAQIAQRDLVRPPFPPPEEEK
ncbi:MAG: hypothetical protein EOO54_19385 [Haliea sp.]|nr:MAG: hypothetical protein EOO54_19385 [Haliea sp.]